MLSSWRLPLSLAWLPHVGQGIQGQAGAPQTAKPYILTLTQSSQRCGQHDLQGC